MPSPIEFFFDFPSGYSFFAALEIDELAARHGRSVRWQAFSLGTAFKRTQASPLTRTPLKAEYTELDWRRIAEAKGVAYRLPEGHPHAGLPALRAFHWIDARDPAAAAEFAKAVFRGYFSHEGLDIDDVAAVAGLGGRLGLDPRALAAGVADAAIKARVREVGEHAVARGVFGAPWTFVDGEPFWGWDRLPMIDRRLAGA